MKYSYLNKRDKNSRLLWFGAYELNYKLGKWSVKNYPEDACSFYENRLLKAKDNLTINLKEVSSLTAEELFEYYGIENEEDKAERISELYFNHKSKKDYIGRITKKCN